MGVEGDCDGSVRGMVFRSVKAESGYLNECVECVVINLCRSVVHVDMQGVCLQLGSS